MEARFLSAVDPTDTTIAVEDNGAIDLFNAAGGTAYIYDDLGATIDFFGYTSISGTTFVGVTGMTLYHEAETGCRPSFGYALAQILAPLETSPAIDEDGFTAILMQLLDIGYSDLKGVVHYLRRMTNPVFAHETLLEDITKSLGVSFNPTRSEAYKRLLAMVAAQALQNKGTADAFKHIAYLILGYHIKLKLVNLLVPFELDTSYGVMPQAPTEFVEEPFTTGLWRMASSPLTAIPNEIAGGLDMDISLAGLWNTAVGCSMFLKDERVDLALVGDYATVRGAWGEKTCLHGKTAFAFEVWFHPSDAGVFPQSIVQKSGVFEIERHDATGLTVTVTDGTTTRTIVADNVLTMDRSEYIAVRFDEEDFSLVVNETMVENQRQTNFSLLDTGTIWGFGGPYGTNPLNGALDMVRLTVGRKYETEFLNYYDHIRVLRTIGTGADETTYMYDPSSQDGCLHVEVSNNDGDVAKHEILRYLVQEWLGAGCNRIIYAGHLPLEIALGWF